MKKNLFLIIVLFAFFFSAVNIQSEDFSGKVINFSGLVYVDGKHVSSGMKILQGSVIKTDDDTNSQIDILLSADHLIRIKNKSELKIVTVKKTKIKINLLGGKIFVKAGKSAEDGYFKIYTPTSVTGVRGTKFLVEENNSKTYICVCEGVVNCFKNTFISRVFGKGKNVKAGYDLWIKSKEDVKEPKHSPQMAQMTESEFREMEQ